MLEVQLKLAYYPHISHGWECVYRLKIQREQIELLESLVAKLVLYMCSLGIRICKILWNLFRPNFSKIQNQVGFHLILLIYQSVDKSIDPISIGSPLPNMEVGAADT